MEITVFNDPNFVINKDVEIDLQDYPVIFEIGDFITLSKSNGKLIVGDNSGKQFILDEQLGLKLLDCCSPILNNFEAYTESVEESSLEFKLASLKEVTEPNLLECKQCKSITLIE